jgi:hypothetical protein
MSSSLAIARLRRIARLLPDEDPDVDWFRRRLQVYEVDPRRLRLDAVLGPVGPSGSTPWWEHEAIANRNQLCRDEARRRYPGDEPAEQARKIAANSLKLLGKKVGEKTVLNALRAGNDKPVFVTGDSRQIIGHEIAIVES